MAKEKLSSDEKFQQVDFDLFDALAAIDRKDYGYYDRLTTEQQRKFVPFMLVHWVSAVKGNKDLQAYYLRSTDYHANTHLFNENVMKHPKLQWMMLCASAPPGFGKQFHQWIPHIKERVSKFKELPKEKDIFDYFKKIYPSASKNDLTMLAEVYVASQSKKYYLANKFPNLKYDEIELLSDLITDQDIKNYEEDSGN